MSQVPREASQSAESDLTPITQSLEVPGSLRSILPTWESHLTSPGLFSYLYIEVPSLIHLTWLKHVTPHFSEYFSLSALDSSRFPPRPGDAPPPSGISQYQKRTPTGCVTLERNPLSNRTESRVPACNSGSDLPCLSPGLSLTLEIFSASKP